jgi:hypothetical protein
MYFRIFVQWWSISTIVRVSASVLAVVMVIAYRELDYRVSLLLIGSIRLKYIALVVVFSNLLFYHF